MTMVTVGVSLIGGGDRTHLVLERATTVEAVVAAIQALVYVCQPALRGVALREVRRLAAVPDVESTAWSPEQDMAGLR